MLDQFQGDAGSGVHGGLNGTEANAEQMGEHFVWEQAKEEALPLPPPSLPPQVHTLCVQAGGTGAGPQTYLSPYQA